MTKGRDLTQEFGCS